MIIPRTLCRPGSSLVARFKVGVSAVFLLSDILKCVIRLLMSLDGSEIFNSGEAGAQIHEQG
jgi:hypothetical protein